MIACTSIPRTNDVQKKPFLVGPPDTSISFPTSASATMLIYNPSIHAKSVTATPTSQVPTLQLRLSYRFANSLASLNPSARNFEAWQPHRVAPSVRSQSFLPETGQTHNPIVQSVHF